MIVGATQSLNKFPLEKLLTVAFLRCKILFRWFPICNMKICPCGVLRWWVVELGKIPLYLNTWVEPATFLLLVRILDHNLCSQDRFTRFCLDCSLWQLSFHSLFFRYRWVQWTITRLQVKSEVYEHIWQLLLCLPQGLHGQGFPDVVRRWAWIPASRVRWCWSLPSF